MSVLKAAAEKARFAVMVPVGPAPLEVERLTDLADALAAYEPGPGWFVMIDDSPMPRGLDRRVSLPPDVVPVALHHRRTRPMSWRNGGGLCASVLMGMQWAQASTDAAFLLKLDTDSLIINPFRQRLCDLLDADPSLGTAGAYTRTPEGLERSWHHHGATVRRMLKPPFDWRHPIRSVTGRHPNAAPEPIKRLIREALRHGYDPGEHCLGGGYVLSRTLLDRAADAGYLSDPQMWMDIDLAEDVMAGIIVRAVGLEPANHVKPGEVFGVRWRGLPAPPPTLVQQDYAVIHAVKNDPHYDEATLRAFFKARRSAGSRRGNTAA